MENLPKKRFFVRHYDFSTLEGSYCYCSPECAEAIRQRVTAAEGSISLIGTGDYHYASLFLQETITRPYSLLLFDNHSDDHDGAFDSGALSCGNWVRSARQLPLCLQSSWVREPVSPEALFSLPGRLYLSIDLDVLSPDCALTDWDQGSLCLDELLAMIRALSESGKVLGADICGGVKGEFPELNRQTIEKIVQTLQQSDSQ